MCSSSPSSSPKNVRWSSGARLTSPSSTASPSRRFMKRQVAQQLVRVDGRAARHAHRLEHERDGVDAEAAEPPSRSQNPTTRAISSRTSGVGDVEVRLVRVEAVQVVLARFLVPRPVESSLSGKTTSPASPAASRQPRRRSRDRASRGPRGRLEPCRSVVHDQVCDHADAAVARRAHHLDEVAVRPEPRVDAVEVGRSRRPARRGRAASATGTRRPAPRGSRAAPSARAGRRSRPRPSRGTSRRRGSRGPRSSTTGRWSPCSSSQLWEHPLPERVDERAELGPRGAGRSRRSRARRGPAARPRRPRSAETSTPERTSSGRTKRAASSNASTVWRSHGIGGWKRLVRHWSYAMSSASLARRPREMNLEERRLARRRLRGTLRARPSCSRGWLSDHEPVGPVRGPARRLGTDRRRDQRRRLGGQRPQPRAVDRDQPVVVDHLAGQQRAHHVDALAQARCGSPCPATLRR